MNALGFTIEFYMLAKFDH